MSVIVELFGGLEKGRRGKEDETEYYQNTLYLCRKMAQ
jgi:hypothetical protein